jgi:class 3 adenylate cyclase
VAVSEQPSGTVTFLFADIEGSTRLWEQHPDAMTEALAQHDALLRAVVRAFSTTSLAWRRRSPVALSTW